MARFSGVTVLLILVTTVSVYTCAIITGAALGRTLDKSGTTKVAPSDRVLRVSVSFRGLAEDFAKELWGANHREGLSGRALHGAGDGRPVPRANRAAAAEHDSALQSMLPVANERGFRNTTQLTRRTRDEAHTRAAARPWSPRHSNFSDEITDEKMPGGRGVNKVGPWGGPGGRGFYMRGARGVSAPGVRSVSLHYSDAIHSFHQSSHEAVVLKRTQEPVGGGSVPVRITTYEQINFASDEQLIAVEGTYGHCNYVPVEVVTSLTFRTDKGTTYGPYGKETGTPFTIQAANGCIVGFWGRSGWLLDAIGVYIRSCQPHRAAS